MPGIAAGKDGGQLYGELGQSFRQSCLRLPTPPAAFFFGALAKEHKHDLLRAAEGTGDTLSLATWMPFGAAVVGQVIWKFNWWHHWAKEKLPEQNDETVR
jgi:hypothetical protein